MLPVLTTLFLLLFFSGCVQRAGPSFRFDEADLPDPVALYSEILNRSEQVLTLRGAARVRLETEQERVSLDAVIVCERGGRLRFEVLDWLNHVVFLALFDEKGFIAYSAPENQYMEGPDDAEQIQAILGIPLKAEALAALALGSPFFLAMADPTLRISVDEGGLLLDAEASDSGVRYLLWLDERRRPERMFVLPAHGGRGGIGGLRVNYGRYRQIDSVSFPHRIRVAATESRSVLQVDYQRVLLNESLEEDLFRFRPPAGASKVSEE